VDSHLNSFNRKENMKKIIVLTIVIAAFILTACQTAPALPTRTATALPTDTPEPTALPTLEPTPTAVLEIGMPVSSENWEVTLLGVVLMEEDVYDSEVKGRVLANEGERYLAVGFIVKPLGEKTSVPISDVVIVDENGQTRGAYYLGSQEAASEIDPFSIEVKRCMMMAITGEGLDIPVEEYFHMIYQVDEASLGQQVTFKFDDVPAIPFIVE
jgi:hypothetical protein